MTAPPPHDEPRWAPTGNVDHSPTSGEHRRGRRGTARGLAAVAAGLLLAVAGWAVDDISATASAVLTVAALVVVLAGCAAVLFTARSSRHGGDPGSGGGFSATGL